MTAPPRPGPVALRPLHQPALLDPVGLLDATRTGLLHGGDVAGAVDRLSDGLWWMRNALAAARWPDIVAVARAHPLAGLLQEDQGPPRAHLRPRRIAGDAPLLDLAHRGRAAPEAQGASPLGLALLDRQFAAPGAAALREQAQFLAGLIDHVAELRAMPSILSAGCGHLPEGQASRALQQRRIARLVAIDQDAEALAQVARDHGGRGVETLRRDLRAPASVPPAPGAFDLAYAAGLYEYLDDAAAADLTAALFALLRPGGRLVVSSPVPGACDAAYAEAFADWFVVHRGPDQLLALAARLDPEQIGLRRVYTRLSPEIFYLELRRRDHA